MGNLSNQSVLDKHCVPVAKKEEQNMVSIKRVVLDVLKPHEPNVLALSAAIAELGEGYWVRLTVVELDKNTETLQLEVAGKDLDFPLIESTLKEMGASLHSIDEVEAQNVSISESQ
jgi:hypothetical protein